tara:strand:- start:769 stop:1470 length:702 start_codon:yes stop_codon:yes gene_type:complete
MEKDSKKSSLWQSTIKICKKFLINFKKFFSKFNPNVLQIIQLTFIYSFAVIDLIYAILNNVFSLGYLPELLLPVFPLIKAILQSPILRVWASPEKVFFMSYVVIEFMIVRSVFKFSKLVRYNILLIFSMLMVQGLAVSYWDVLFHRAIATPVAKWAFDKGALIHTDKTLAIVFFFNTFMIFMLAYLYLYLRAISGKFGTIPGMEWLTDSVAFWLRIRTPTMRVGKRRKKRKKK